MDAINRDIINLLKVDARASFVAIGKKVGLSAPAVGKRVKQLEEQGIIEGYDLRLNVRKLGIDIKAFITLKLDRSKNFQRFKSDIIKLHEVIQCHRVTGEDCLILLAHFNDNLHLINFIDNISKYGSTKTNIILD